MDLMIRNVYCVGRNYRLHAAELGNDIPKKPMIFMKPSHAVIPLDNSVISLPKDQGEVHYEGELVILIDQDYEPGMTVDSLVKFMALGIDFTLRDVQQVIKEKGHPWTAAKGFKSSAPLTAFIPFPGIGDLATLDFTVNKNKIEVQRGNANDMIFSLQKIVEYIGTHYGLGKGDIIFTGTPAGVGPVSAGDEFELLWGDTQLGSCVIQ
ncbi:fumarylacetoacetate hydrolase family protein [Paenibacillus crassostreae]|uniref:Fumarylacetoacetate hydrolase n=1 Tax=Paenibacillus crassostreae TaxID=1763538 RepID=A0A167FXU7_9BACL|nr:fumarylacetoacetate hydrolase family protein [Paenibacillus crassostreae]AOZ93961.1 fumarylacetoacetate hydrolase [Paenibacillus crassostreae]OAB77006.1 fumarylacetoacetate hydrolase [Paenibacillus crassostreae]